jgi:hypothetical protein
MVVSVDQSVRSLTSSLLTGSRLRFSRIELNSSLFEFKLIEEKKGTDSPLFVAKPKNCGAKSLQIAYRQTQEDTP